MIELPTGLNAELVPLSWLIGVWEGTGVIDYTVGETKVTQEFGQRVSFSHDGLPHLNYSSYTWIIGANDDDDVEPEPIATETGYWRLSRSLTEADPGPGLLPGGTVKPFQSAAAVETLRNSSNGFDIEVALVHPGGLLELYLGQVAGARIDLATDAVVRSSTSKEYSAATRMYGLVDSHLLWAWDIAALGQDLRTHASARLAKAE